MDIWNRSEREFAEIGRVAASFALVEDVIERCRHNIEDIFPEESKVRRAAHYSFDQKCEVLNGAGAQVLHDHGNGGKQRVRTFEGFIAKARTYAVERNK